VWDAATGNTVASHTHPRGLRTGWAFSPDGIRVLGWGFDGAAVWEATTGKVVAFIAHDGGTGGAAFSPDGARVLSWGAQTIQIDHLLRPIKVVDSAHERDQDTPSLSLEVRTATHLDARGELTILTRDQWLAKMKTLEKTMAQEGSQDR
jgi:hypothetical protein